MIGRELVYSTWYGRWQGYEKMSTFYFNNIHTYLYEISQFCVQICPQFRLKCCWVEHRLFLQLPTGFLSVSSSLKALFPCFEHFYARIIAKIRLRFAIWAFSSLRIQIYFLKAWYSAGSKTRKISFLPLINTVPTSADTLKFLYVKYFLLPLMYLLRQYIY